MEEQLDIYVRGFVRGSSPELGLVRLFHLHPLRALELVQSLPRTVKHRVTRAQAERYAQALRQIGAEVELRPSAIAPQRIIPVEGAAERQTRAPDPQASGRTLTLPPPPAAQESIPVPARVVPAPAPSALTYTYDIEAPPPSAAVPAFDIPGSSAQTQPGFVLPAPVLAGLRMSGPPRAAVLEPERTPRSSDRQALVWPPDAGPASIPMPVAGLAPVQPAPVQPPPSPTPISLPPVPQAASAADSIDLPPSIERAPHRMTRPNPPGVPTSTPGLAAEPLRTSLPSPRLSAPRVSRMSVGTVGQAVHIDRNSVSRSKKPGWLPADAYTFVSYAARFGIATSVFFAIASLRACPSVSSGVRTALADWSHGPALDAPFGDEHGPRAPVAAGRNALDWCTSEQHQFSNGDKDVVRALIGRLTGAGADVSVSGILTTGPVSIATELQVALPSDLAKRREIYEVLRAFRSANWHFDPGAARPGADPFEGKASITVDLS